MAFSGQGHHRPKHCLELLAIQANASVVSTRYNVAVRQ